MSKNRAVLFAGLLLFLGGCGTWPSAGIIDVFVPPQAEPLAPRQMVVRCEEAVSQSPPGELSAQDAVTCVMEVLTPAETTRGNGIPRTSNPRRLPPPRARR